jgi:hypothetical protein
MSTSEEYYCALSGLASDTTGEDEGDEFSDLPEGWLKVVIQRRVMNPDWIMVQNIKSESLDQMLSQITEDQMVDGVKRAVELQIEAQYVALEEKLGRYIVFEETQYIADPQSNKQVAVELQSVLSKLELDLEDFGVSFEKEEKIEEEEEEEAQK